MSKVTRPHASRESDEQREEQRISRYLKDRIKALETVYDEKAVRLILCAGVLSADNPDGLDRAIAELASEEAEDLDKYSALMDRIRSATIPLEDRRPALSEFENYMLSRQFDYTQAAYLLGIAVGRRLGPGALRLPGGVR